MVLDFSLAFIFLGKTVKTHSYMVSANIQMAASLSTVKSVADVSGTSKGSNVLGKYRWLQPPVLVGTCPALSHYFSSTGKRQLDLTSKKHCGSASQMM